MKYLLVIFTFFINEALSVQNNYSSVTEDCSYSTQDTHTVSEGSYNKLLAQLTEEDTEKENRNQPQRSQKGQR
ncbi:MAG: hypothetical protein OXN83_05320 [Oligoflexia bacterium]|nr:hypothetical protein [Oligoflexia bacterium]